MGSMPSKPLAGKFDEWYEYDLEDDDADLEVYYYNQKDTDYLDYYDDPFDYDD